MSRCPSCGRDSPDSAARFCSSCGSALTETPVPAGEMRKLVTVLFADVVGSTALGEARDPEDARALMGEYFSAMAEEIRAEGGTLEKFIGDAIMAVFGVPAAHEDDAARAVRAGRRMLARLDHRNAGVEPPDRIEIRIGVNTGDVLAAGTPGQDLLVTGDAVNVASRLQERAEPGSLVIGERTARAVRAAFELRPLEALTLKGKTDGVAAWTVEGERADVERYGVPGLTAPIVGRDGELEVLQSLFEQLERERSPHLVTIVGDPGIGKTRLVREFLSGPGGRARTIVGRCLPHGEAVTFWPLREILKAESGILDTDPAAAALAKLGDLVRETLTEELATEPERTIAALATTIDLVDPHRPPADVSPRQARRELLAAWRVLLSSLASADPLVVVVEDIHWAEPALLDALEDLADHVEGPLLFLCTTRPELLESRPGWGGGRRNYSALPLDPLTTSETARLVSYLLELEHAPLADALLARAEGNPLFAEEILRRLIDEGRLVREGGRWRMTGDLAEIEVPDSVQAVIFARLDLLRPDEKRALQLAAVIGRSFWLGALARAAGEGGLDEILEALVRRELVVERLASSIVGELEYGFRHVLIHEVAYASLPRRERGRAHATVAEWIEESRGERRDELAEMLAHHYSTAFLILDEAELRVRARRYCLLAARNALRRFAIEQAETFGWLAVDFSNPGLERVEALDSLGELYALTWRGDGAWKAYTEAIAELQSGPADPALLARLAAGASTVVARRQPTMSSPPSEAELEALIAAGLEAAGTSDSRDRALLLIARAALRPSRSGSKLEAGIEAANEAVALAERLGDPDLVSSAIDAGNMRLLGEGRYGEIYRRNRRRLELVPRLSDVGEICDAHIVAAWSAALIGHYPQAIEHASACMERARGVDAGQYVNGLVWREWASFGAGEWEQALADQSAIEEHQRDAGGSLPPFVVFAYAVAMLCRELRGERAQADAYLELLRDYRADGGDRALSASLALTARTLAHRGEAEAAAHLLTLSRPRYNVVDSEALCEVLAAGADWTAALKALPKLHEEAAHGELLALPCYADRLEARAAAASGETERAQTLLRRSAAGFDDLGAPWEAACSRLALGEVMLIAGDDRAGERELAAALPVFERLRAVQERERARELLETVHV